MRDWQNFFKAEDFAVVWCEPEHSHKTMDVEFALSVAERANQLLREELEKAPVVYFDDQETANLDGYFEGNFQEPKEFHTHTAKLIDVREIE